MRLTQTLLLSTTALWSLVSADVEFASPAAGASVAGGTPFLVSWRDSGIAPSLIDLTSYELSLYSGSNDNPQQLYSISTNTFSATSGNTVSVTIPQDIGGDGINAYFFGMISTLVAGGTVVNYSDRFTITGMTGFFAPSVKTALVSVSGTSGPNSTSDFAGALVVNKRATATAVVDAAQYATPYESQTGVIRYASMQPVPGSTITATNTAPLFATSSVVLATTYLTSATIVTTVTQSGTQSVSSHANTASAAPMPSDDMAKFLARWKD
ncbi:hypothetical protein BP5796_10042 [Coleophoma crateriformis]|uniref:Uncharacterized protein n=1 Tax=Coleophoma crateriformis TaxID=565419 RepID=A0A3D8QUL5_9HELO|nr:hypothetical protein BP5796_10042 [Coleophoma crateriformis]